MDKSQSRPIRDLLRGLDRAALATSLPSAAAGSATGGEGWPYVSLVLVALDHDLSPILLLSELAEHGKAIVACDRVALLFDGTRGLDQPLAGPRVSLLGRAAPTADERLRRRFLARHPDAAMYSGFADFRFYRVALERAHLVGGFGKIAWLTPAELVPAPPPAALIAAEPDIVAHMNRDHAEALDRCANRLLGLAGTGWRMTGIDAEGVDLRLGGAVARLGLPEPIDSPQAARKALIELAARARAA